ncbi:phage protease [Methylomonas sp. 11b]|uniref:phage protease n=1 Tax=Methylomonas sp. 11b TaxID=1168169 RepID=UPI0004793058|nr:phage protease [Methylomonas sp. 11b]
MSKLLPHIAACLFSLSPSDDGAMQLFPAGTFDASRGALRGKGPWKIDADIAGRVIAAVSKRKSDICIDYEHQSILTAKNGQPVIAAGWISPQSLEWREPPAAYPGLFAVSPKLTAVASAHIARDEIRYVSPVFTYDPKTGEVLDIINVALTNNPAIDGMQAVTVAAASMLAADLSNTPTENPMELDELLERLRYLFNLPTLAATNDIIAELDKAKSLLAAQPAATSLLDLLDSTKAEVAALSAQLADASAEPDPTLYVPIAVVTELRGKLAALSSDSVELQVAKLIEQGELAGKILGDAEKAWATSLGKKDLAALSAYLDSATGIAALSGMQTEKTDVPKTEVAVLSAEQKQVCKNMGLSEAAYLESLQEIQ